MQITSGLYMRIAFRQTSRRSSQRRPAVSSSGSPVMRTLQVMMRVTGCPDAGRAAVAETAVTQAARQPARQSIKLFFITRVEAIASWFIDEQRPATSRFSTAAGTSER